MKTIEGVAKTPASRDAVWAQLADVSKWSRWGSWSEASVEGGGGQQVGAVRVLVRRPYRVRERITEWVPGERMAYEMIEGMNVDGYRSVVALEDAPEGGTVVRWTSTYDKAGLVAGLVLRMAIPDSAKRVAKAAAAG
jgi:hypothetical protein